MLPHVPLTHTEILMQDAKNVTQLVKHVHQLISVHHVLIQDHNQLMVYVIHVFIHAQPAQIMINVQAV